MTGRFVLGSTGGLGKQVVRLTSAVGVGREWCNLESKPHDASSPANWATSLDAIEGELHVLNLAGQTYSAMLHKDGEPDQQRLLNVNLMGNARLLKALRPVFKNHPGSTFTMVGSVTARLGTVGTGIYSATKSALEGLTRVAAHEFAPFARVNLLNLGYCDMGMIANVRNVAEVVASIPLRRLGTSADVAEAWKFFIACKYVTGAIVNVNGGLC